MKKETFVKGMTLICECFNRQLNTMIYWELLQDLNDESFTQAVMNIIKTERELYPNTNLVAIIREKTKEFEKARISKIDSSKLIDTEPAPPPEEWNELKERLTK